MGILNWSGKQIASGYKMGSGVLGRTGMGAANWAVVGGLYGATLGRDPGQSRFGGAFTGALAGAGIGAGLGRYGGAMIHGAAGGRILGRTGYRQSLLSPGALQRSVLGSWGGAFGGAGRALWKNASFDAKQAYNHIGTGINKAYNSFKALHSA